MGFDIKPGMSCWNSMGERYKKEYHIYAAKMEKRKFENDRKMRQKKKIKPLSFSEKNQRKIEKIWKKELKIEKEKELKIEKEKELKELKIEKKKELKEKYKNDMIKWMEY